ncbi:MAG: HD domain-containing protein [Lachnospiraceae bacterium]|nr:HD domain-containing protein [Lachnospiraceae bacterium]
MVLTEQDNRRLELLLMQYEEDEHVQEMKNYVQHGIVSTYDHCKNVARVSFWLNQRFNLCADEKALAIGAFLHDFYLYDWHIPEASHRLHGFSHAETARCNAVKYFKIAPEIQQIIQSHMWPLNITRIPRSREAVIVCAADKICSIIETVCQRKNVKNVLG